MNSSNIRNLALETTSRMFFLIIFRSTYEAAQWFYNHLATQVPIVMVSEDPDVVVEYSNKTVGVFVLGLENYMNNFWPDLKAAHDLFESLAASVQESKQKGRSIYWSRTRGMNTKEEKADIT
jgi:hypothetical protein